MQYEIDQKNKQFILLDDNGNKITSLRYLNEPGTDKQWFGIDGDNEEAILDMVRNSSEFDLIGNGDSVSFSLDKLSKQRPLKQNKLRKKPDGETAEEVMKRLRDLKSKEKEELESIQDDMQSSKRNRKEMSPLNRQILDLTVALRKDITNEQKNRLQEKLNHLKTVKKNQSEYKEYLSEYEIIRGNIKTICNNLKAAIGSNKAEAARTYWNILSGGLSYLEQQEEEAAKVDMDPESYIYIREDEFGSFPEPDRDILSNEYLKTYKPTGAVYKCRLNSKLKPIDKLSFAGMDHCNDAIKAAHLYHDYIPKIGTLRAKYSKYDRYLGELQTDFARIASDLIWMVLPPISNKRSRLEQRLGASKLRYFAAEINRFRHKFYSMMKRHGKYINPKDLLAEIENSYTDGIEPSKPTLLATELAEKRKEKHGYTDTQNEIYHLLS